MVLDVLMTRNPQYLDWLRDQPCMTCGRMPNIDDRNQASHVGVSNFGIKPPDNQCVPQCGRCHSLFEYNEHDFAKQTKKIFGYEKNPPTLEDCEFYFNEWKNTR